MCIVCILFLLAVHRLVLIVNSWDVFLGGGVYERGGRLSPYYWNSVLLRPDESFRICFCFICIFPELEEFWEGSVLQSWRTRRVEDYDKEKNNISPWRKNKKNQWLFFVVIYLTFGFKMCCECVSPGGWLELRHIEEVTAQWLLF